MNIKFLHTPALLLVLLGACSSSPEDVAAQKNEARLEAVKNQQEIEQENRLQEADDLPDGVLNVPAPDATGYYAVGYGESKTIFKAISKSLLKAEFGLAKVIKQEVSGSERSFEKDSGVGTEQEQYQVVIDKLIDSVPVVGYTQVSQELITERGIHMVYTLLKMPYEQYNKILENQRKNALNTEAKEAFSELELRLEKKHQALLEESKLKHKQKMEEIKANTEYLNSTNESKDKSLENSANAQPTKVTKPTLFSSIASI